MQLRLVRTVTFRAWHRLSDSRATDADNRAWFGATVDPHPHDYRCEVAVAGPVDERLPMVMDLATLDRLLTEQVVEPWDGKHLHRDDPAFRDTLPTCEGMAREVFRRLAPRLPTGVHLAAVTIAEDDRLRAECRP